MKTHVNTNHLNNALFSEQALREDRTCFDTELMTEQAQSPAYKILHQASFRELDSSVTIFFSCHNANIKR